MIYAHFAAWIVCALWAGVSLPARPLTAAILFASAITHGAVVCGAWLP